MLFGGCGRAHRNHHWKLSQEVTCFHPDMQQAHLRPTPPLAHTLSTPPLPPPLSQEGMPCCLSPGCNSNSHQPIDKPPHQTPLTHHTLKTLTPALFTQHFLPHSLPQLTAGSPCSPQTPRPPAAASASCAGHSHTQCPAAAAAAAAHAVNHLYHASLSHHNWGGVVCCVHSNKLQAHPRSCTCSAVQGLRVQLWQGTRQAD